MALPRQLWCGETGWPWATACQTDSSCERLKIGQMVVSVDRCESEKMIWSSREVRRVGNAGGKKRAERQQRFKNSTLMT